MRTSVDEIAEGVYRISTFVPEIAPPAGFTFNQFLIAAEQVRRAVRNINTPHVPHNWEARVLFEEHTRTLFCGDLFTQLGDGPAVTEEDLVEAALESEQLFRQTSCLTAAVATLRSLAALEPRTLAVMHGSSFRGDGAAALRAMADGLEQRFGPEADFVAVPSVLAGPHP
ncbi:hypothetical protein [Kitasatospora sp. LaBMicrA B282]|uniref:hypothetical protein n=1 Tax=Kitasatospora sp. LaBMicrA B282 TaxID=3420949 RepID=UPI003D0FAE9D